MTIDPPDPAFDHVRHQAGVELTERIAEAIAPVIDGQPIDLAIDAMLSGVLALMMALAENNERMACMLHLAADRMTGLALSLIPEDNPQ